MNTKKSARLNNSAVEKVTQLFRAYKHPYRYEIINSLLVHGQMTAAELSSFIGMPEPYILEQLDILARSTLVLASCPGEDGLRYAANEPILIRMKNGVGHLV